MKVGIIIHSHSGNTRTAAARIQQKLEEQGHSVQLEQLQPGAGWKPGDKPIELETIPDPQAFDFVIFGAPVEAFSLSPVMDTYLRAAPSMEGQRCACYVTQFFPFAWMGGNRAVRQLQKLCAEKGAVVDATSVINWSSPGREHRMTATADRFKGLI